VIFFLRKCSTKVRKFVFTTQLKDLASTDVFISKTSFLFP